MSEDGVVVARMGLAPTPRLVLLGVLFVKMLASFAPLVLALFGGVGLGVVAVVAFAVVVMDGVDADGVGVVGVAWAAGVVCG